MADKQTALVKSIADGVLAALGPEFAKLSELIVKQTVTSNTILARLECVESAVSSGGTTAKRAVRTGAAAKAGAAKKAGAKKGSSGSDESKVTNALLFCRFKMANDDEFRETYGTEENILEAEKDPTVAKRDKDKDPNGYWSAVGAAVWKSALTDDQKNEIRTAFTAWKEQATRDGAEEQLEEEATAQ